MTGTGTTSTEALAFGGETPGSARVTNTESWNGSAWTEVNDLNTANFQSTGLGSYTAALNVGGNIAPGETANTEDWNGSGWTEVADLSAARQLVGGAGTTSAGLAFGGSDPSPPAVTTATEEWSGSSSTIKVLTD